MRKILFAITLASMAVMPAYSIEKSNIKHRPLVEDYTALSCGWCLRGNVALEMLANQYPDDHVAVSYHVGDEMAVLNNFAINAQAVPVATIDRGSRMDPYYGVTERQDFQISEELEKAMAVETPAGIEVTAELKDGKVNVSTEVMFLQDFDKANYNIGYILVCNGLTNGKWLQINDYADYKDKPTFKGTPLEELTELGLYVRGYVFNDVVVDASNIYGVAGSLPQEIKEEEVYTHSYSFDISRNTLVQDPDNLVAVAFIIDRNSGKIVNSNKYVFASKQPEENGVGAIADDAEVLVTDFYTLSGIKVANPGPGLYIRQETLSNGSSRTSKVILK